MDFPSFYKDPFSGRANDSELPHTGAFGEVTKGHHCAGYEYPAVALDEQQFALFWRILPWDHVAGALIIRESGGTALHLDGSMYRPTDDDRGLLVAPNDDVWHTVRDTLFTQSFRD